MSRLSTKQWDLLTRIVAAAFFISASITAILGYLSFSPITVVEANTSDITSARSRYPALAGSRIDSCSLCHTSSIPSLNSYGAAYKAAGRSLAALAAIENQDSDRDGFTNLAEISAFFFPGDPNDRPATATATSAPPTPLPPTPTQPAPPTPTQPAPPTATLPPPTPTQPAPTDIPPTSQPTDPPVIDPTATIAPTLQPSPTLEPSPTATQQCKNDDDKEKKDKDKKDKDKKDKDKKDKKDKDKKDKDHKPGKPDDDKKNNPCKPDDDKKDDDKEHSLLIFPDVLAFNDAGARRMRLNG